MRLPPSTARLAEAMTWAHTHQRPVRTALRRGWLYCRRHPDAVDLGLPCAGFLGAAIVLSGAWWFGLLVLLGALSVACGCALELTRTKP